MKFIVIVIVIFGRMSDTVLLLLLADLNISCNTRPRSLDPKVSQVSLDRLSVLF